MSEAKQIITDLVTEFNVDVEVACDKYAKMIAAPADMTNQEANNYIEASVGMFRRAFAKQIEGVVKQLKVNAEDSLALVNLTDLVEAVEIGNSEVVFDNEFQSLVVTKKRPASRLDGKKFATELAKAGVDQEIIDNAMTAATTTNKPATTIEVVNTTTEHLGG